MSLQSATPASAEAARPDQGVRPFPGLRWLGMILRLWGRLHPRSAAALLIALFSLPGRRARHYREDALLRSALRGRVLIPGGHIRTYTWGDGPRRILLLHGWQSRGTALRYFVPPLQAEGFTVVAMDAPAHGESSGWRMTLPAYAEAILAVEKALGPFEGAITHSFGSRALSYALVYLPYAWTMQRVVMLAAPGNLTRIFQGFFDLTGATEALREACREAAGRMFRRPVESLEMEVLAPLLPGRLLVIHDEDDEVVPAEEARRILAVLPTAHLMITRGWGHYRMARSPEIRTRAVRFLSVRDE